MGISGPGLGAGHRGLPQWELGVKDGIPAADGLAAVEADLPL